MTAPAEVLSVLRAGEIRYSQVWEDHVLLHHALRPGRGHDVLSIASAGDNVLNLLLRRPRSVTAVDINPAQTALLHLKLAALEVLSHSELVGLLGVRDWGNRLALYERVRPHLDLTARSYWDAHEPFLETGVIHAGRLERYFAGFRRDVLAALGLTSVVSDMLEARTLSGQVRIFEERIATPQLERAFISYFGWQHMAEHGRDATQLHYVEPNVVGRVFWQRFRAACTARSLRGNFYLEYLLTGGYRDLEHGPPYLRPTSFARLRQSAPAVTVVTASLEDFLPACRAASFNGANLSDVFEYFSEDETAQLLERLARVMRAGGRLCFWNLLVPRSVPPSHRHRWRARSRSARELASRDRTGFYSAFHIEEALAA